MFCQVEPSSVIAVHDVSSTYHVPLLLANQGLIPVLRSTLHLSALTIPPSLLNKGAAIWTEWKRLTMSQDHLQHSTVTIALVGKYTKLHDSYLSVVKSLEHAAMRCLKKLNLVWVDASDLEEVGRTTSSSSSATPNGQDSHHAAFHKAWHSVCTADGILVPGGFGSRGIEGMIAAARWARIHQTPFLGICLGMQIAVIEYARNVCGIPGASSEEFDEHCADPLVVYMPEIDKDNLGGTMRLGLRPTLWQDGSEWSRLRALYGDGGAVQERHRHRYEVNPAYIDRLHDGGLDFIGKDEKGVRMEIFELRPKPPQPAHPWYVGVQFHPEYLSRVLHPSKPYLGFVAAASRSLDAVIARTSKEGHMGALTNGTAAVVI